MGSGYELHNSVDSEVRLDNTTPTSHRTFIYAHQLLYPGTLQKQLHEIEHRQRDLSKVNVTTVNFLELVVCTVSVQTCYRSYSPHTHTFPVSSLWLPGLRVQPRNHRWNPFPTQRAQGWTKHSPVVPSRSEICISVILGPDKIPIPVQCPALF